MKVYLVQHAEAMSEEQNPDRPLTDLGREHAAWTGNLAGRLGVEVDRMIIGKRPGSSRPILREIASRI